MSMIGCASASATLNLTGVWSANYHCETGTCAGKDFPATDTLTQSGGVIAGTNETETIAGTLTGRTFVYHSSTGGGYKAKGTLTIATDGRSWSGPAEDTNGTTGTYTATRNPPPTGALSQLPSPSNCVSVEGATGDMGCGTLIPSGLEKVVHVAVSPDNRNVYAAGTNALIEFSRSQATGALEEIGCVTGGATTCSATNDTPDAIAMDRPEAIAVSPDGKNVYVTTEEAGPGVGAVVTFSRESGTGLLTETGCISHSPSSECAIKNAHGLEGPGEVVVSADGLNVYTASFEEQAVAEFVREPTTGALSRLSSPNECISSSAVKSECATTNASGLEEASSVALSTDGKNLYVAATGSGGSSGGDIAEFERDTSKEGVLKQLKAPNSCLTSTGVTGCATANDISGPGELVVSPDGKNVYANSFGENAVLEFARDESTGDLSQVPSPNECISTKVIGGCSLAKGIEGPFGVAISPDGSDLYATGIGANAIATFERAASGGALTQFAVPYECITENASGCATNNAVGLKAAWLPVISPDGANVYVGGEHGQLVEFARAHRLGGLNIAGYCESLGDNGKNGKGEGPAVLVKEEITGPEYAYNNWACVRDDGTEVPIAVTGPAPSMDNACSAEFPGVFSYGYPEDPNNAFTWNCYSLLPIGEEKEKEAGSGGGGGGGGGEPPAKASSLVTLIAPVAPFVVPPPVLAHTGNVAPVSGTVLVKLPGTNKFVPLSALRQIPFGSVIDATNGIVSVTTAIPGGKTQTGQFFSGEFILRQGPNGLVVAELTGGNFSVCPTKRERSHIAQAGSVLARAAASGKHVVRKLWANAHGKFSTKGNYAAGAVQGTEWLTEDLCDGTLIRVTRDKVAVTNLVNHRHVVVKTGHKYLAKAP
jgi:DNA-binding beta-propeller fold protein YncE